MANEVLSTSAEVLRIVGLFGIVIAPVVASIVFDIAILYKMEENLKDHPFYSGMLWGAYWNHGGRTTFYAPQIRTHAESIHIDINMAIILSAFCTGTFALACAFLACPVAAISIVLGWSSCFGLYLLGEGLRNIAKEERNNMANASTPTMGYSG
jgi:hypothetical protein